VFSVNLIPKNAQITQLRTVSKQVNVLK